MTYEQRTHWRALILQTKGKECPLCHQPRDVKFHSELNNNCDRFVEVCLYCKTWEYVDISYGPERNNFTIEVVSND